MRFKMWALTAGDCKLDALHVKRGILTSWVSPMEQHSAIDVIMRDGSMCNVDSDDGIAYDGQKPRHALVVTGKATQPAMYTVLVKPATEDQWAMTFMFYILIEVRL